MRAEVGDRLHVHGRTVGDPDQWAEVIEVRGEDGGPPYLVCYADGHETLIFPGERHLGRVAAGELAAPPALRCAQGRASRTMLKSFSAARRTRTPGCHPAE